MNNASQQIVNMAWSFAHVLRDDGLSYMERKMGSESIYLVRLTVTRSEPRFTLKPPSRSLAKKYR